MKSIHVKINKSNSIRGDIIAGFAHELKTPIASVKEAVSLLVDLNKVNCDKKIKHILSIAESEINRLIKMIDNLLEISLFESGKIRLYREKTKIDEIINRTIGSKSFIIQRKNVRIKKYLIANAPRVIIDKDRIFEVVANLLDNAIKFTPEYGTITISTQIIKIDEFQLKKLYLNLKQEYVKFTITDTGPGISKRNLTRIFQKFERPDTDRKIRGSGLGLAIAQNIIELHKGKIWATSEKGKGASFHFVIPVER